MNRIILVNSHRRSGTHFLIDSLRSNMNNFIFPNHRNLPKDFNIGSLFRKNDAIYNIFKDILYYDNQNKTIILKSHLLPQEMDLSNPKDKHEELVKKIFTDAQKIYIYREGRDVLVSLYHFLASHSQISFSSFIREPNDHIPPIRKPKKFDSNRVKYWSYNVNSWLQKNSVTKLQFSDLKYDFKNTIKELIKNLTGEDKVEITKPEIPSNKFLHRIKLKLYNLGLYNNLRSTSIKPRKGKVGDYKDYFSEKDIKFYKEQASEVLNLFK